MSGGLERWSVAALGAQPHRSITPILQSRFLQNRDNSRATSCKMKRVSGRDARVEAKQTVESKGGLAAVLRRCTVMTR